MKSEFHQLMDALKFMAVVYLAVLSRPCHSGFVFDESEIQSNESISRLYGRWKNHFDVTRWSDSDPEKAERLEAFARTAVSASKLERPTLNNLADMTPQEFNRLTSCLSDHPLPAALFTGSDLQTVTLPALVDWRVQRAVLPVRVQGDCGACWAFAAADTIASIRCILTRDLEELSVQQLVDCVKESCGCKHGNILYAFEYIIKNQGIMTEADYPYQNEAGQCRYNPFYDIVTINGYKVVPQGDEDALRQAVAMQPVAAAIDASSVAFRDYAGGIFYGPCYGRQGHAVTIVGYSYTPAGNFWILKNSWSANWGDKGYMMLAFGHCRIAQQAIYPTIQQRHRPTSNISKYLTKDWAVAY